MLVFMLLIVVGFTVPLFNLGGEPAAEEASNYAEARLCQADSDCYLICGEQPKKVLCLQNLCQLNACGEYELYPYQEEPLKFSLSVQVEGKEAKGGEGTNIVEGEAFDKTLDLSLYSNSLDMFTKFKGSSVEVHTAGLSLSHILEKAGISLEGKCLLVGGESYCTDEKGDGGEEERGDKNGNGEKELKFMLNGEEFYDYNYYVPQEGDKVEIIYS